MIDKEQVRQIVGEWLSGRDYFLVSLEVSADNCIVVEIDHADGVWLEDCVGLSRHIESRLDRDKEDFELEVGSAGLGQPFKVERQYTNNIGRGVEVMTAEGRKISGTLVSAGGGEFTLRTVEKVAVEGKKRPVKKEVERTFRMDGVKYCRQEIKFK